MCCDARFGMLPGTAAGPRTMPSWGKSDPGQPIIPERVCPAAWSRAEEEMGGVASLWCMRQAIEVPVSRVSPAPVACKEGGDHFQLGSLTRGLDATCKPHRTSYAVRFDYGKGSSFFFFSLLLPTPCPARAVRRHFVFAPASGRAH